MKKCSRQILPALQGGYYKGHEDQPWCDGCVVKAILSCSYGKPRRLCKLSEPEGFYFVLSKIDFNTSRWRSGVKEQFFYKLEMSGAHCGWSSVGTWMADALLSAMWLLLVLKCYLKCRPFGLLHFSVDKQSKPACGGNLADWSYGPLFNPPN